MEDKTVFKCIRNVVAKYDCKILQLAWTKRVNTDAN